MPAPHSKHRPTSAAQRKRMDELTEFARFHNLPPSLRTKIHNYVDFAFSVTKGINVDSISAQLPAPLQVRSADGANPRQRARCCTIACTSLR